MGGLSAIREIEEYKYPSFLLFSGEGGEEREADFDIFLPKLKKNFEVKVRLRVTKSFKHQNPRIWSIIGRRKWRKRSVWAGNSKKRKKRGGYCDLTSY